MKQHSLCCFSLLWIWSPRSTEPLKGPLQKVYRLLHEHEKLFACLQETIVCAQEIIHMHMGFFVTIFGFLTCFLCVSLLFYYKENESMDVN